jgi:putative glutamine amidotransferase
MAIEQDKPLLGICAGFNNILRALGSDVVLDKTGNHNHYDISYRHPVKIEKGTMLYELIGSKEYSVNSIHTMVAQKDMVSPFADINAYSEDGLVEGFEMDDMNFVLGLKWHPELMREEKFTQRLFEVFMDQCREF